MKHIDEVLSAYVMHCSFPFELDVHVGAMYETLRTTSSRPTTKFLQEVLFRVRNSDPSDEMTQANVRELLLQHLRGDFDEPESPYQAKFFMREERYVFILLLNDAPIGFAVSTEEKFAECCEELKKQFPGISIVQAS